MTDERTDAGPERPPRRRPVSRTEDDRHFLHRHGVRILVFLGGLALIAAGGIMLVTPGPGWLAIIGGFALWATEFEWAERRLDRLKDRFEAVARKAGVDPKKAAIGAILTVVVIAVAGTAAWWFFLR